MIPVTISNIHVGLNIINSKGEYGYISECLDPYNIKVSLKDGDVYHCSITEGSGSYEILHVNL